MTPERELAEKQSLIKHIYRNDKDLAEALYDHVTLQFEYGRPMEESIAWIEQEIRWFRENEIAKFKAEVVNG